MMKTEKEIRKAYFSGKLDKLLDEMAAEEPITEEEVAIITTVLEGLEKEKNGNRAVANYFEGKIEPPSANQLFHPTPEEQKKLDAFLAGSQETIKTVREIIAGAQVAIEKGNKLKRDHWLDLGLSVISLMFSIEQYEIVYEQLYRFKLTEIIDSYRVSRAEAEERAKLTPEYRRYREAIGLKNQILEFEMLAKKYASIE